MNEEQRVIVLGNDAAGAVATELRGKKFNLVPVEKPIPKPKPRGYQHAPAGTTVKASNGVEYIKQEDGSLRRRFPKVKKRRGRGRV